MRFASLPFPLQFTLATASVCFNPSYDGSPDRALAAFESWEHTWTQQGIDAARFTRPCRMRVLAMNGRLDEALRAGTVEAGVRDLHEEWLSAPARTFEALLRVQRGEFREALSLAETTRQIIMLHDISPTISGDLEGFALFLAHWARGTTISARQTLEELTGPVRPDFAAVHTTAGLIELALAMFALQEARWYDAAEITGRMLENLTLNDPFGVTPLVHAVASLAHAALGDETQAVDSLRKCDTRAPGISRALHGFVGSITLQTRHWLRDPDLLAHARRLAEWARGEDLPLIELEALDVVAHETASPDTALIERATALASRVDPPIGDAILGHIRALTQTHEPGAPDPEERLLSELGIWQPLPPVGQLTGREREIALFTALGYSSKHIAERLHLSARTIETHLAHVYGKLGVGGREELRRWFSRRREAQ
jgi:DNA-binding CsgD family transcriptional regulator